jgi:hypothetical protein
MCAPAANIAVPNIRPVCRITRPPRKNKEITLVTRQVLQSNYKTYPKLNKPSDINNISRDNIRCPKTPVASTENELFKLSGFDSEKLHYQLGTTLKKKSKYSVSSTYNYNIHSKRSTYPTLNTKPSSYIRNQNSTWILCQRNILRARSKRAINPKQLIQNHSLLPAPKTRQWQPVIPVFRPKLYNYFQPLSAYTHGPETKMTTEKAKSAASIRLNMVKLRTTGQPMLQTKLSFTNGGRSGTNATRGGRGGGSRSRSPKLQHTRIKTSSIKQTPSTVSISTSASLLTPPTVSDLTEITTTTNGIAPVPNITTTTTQPSTQQHTDDMEEEGSVDEEDEELAPILLSGTPQTIPSFKPNKQWVRDTELGGKKTKYGIEIKIEPKKHATTETEPPSYNHIRIFTAIASAILTAAPTTVIHSIDDNDEALDDVEEIPTLKSSVEKYLETPIVNTKTHTYHARITISCIKPLFIIMKNEAFLQWLIQNKIYLEENNLDTILPSHVGLIFFIHTRASLNGTHLAQLRSNLQGDDIPPFKIKSWKAKSQEYEGRVYLIQAIQSDSEKVHRKFEYSRKTNPYEYISWKSWSDLNIDKKASLIEQHNKYIKDYRLLTLPGFIDDNDIPLGNIDHEPGEQDYSKKHLNEFLMSHYTIGNPPSQILAQVLGPTNGIRQFIVSTYLEKVAKDLLQNLHYDMLSYMSDEAGRQIIPNYEDKVLEAAENPVWEPNWFEENIVPIQKTSPPAETRAVKRQKANPPTTYSAATKEATATENKQGPTTSNHTMPSMISAADAEKMAFLEQQVVELQTKQVDLLEYIKEVKTTQRTIQTELIKVTNNIETVDRNTQLVTRDMRECKAEVLRLEAGIATLTTKQETMEMFNQIVSMFGAVNTSLQNLQSGATQANTTPNQVPMVTDTMMHDEGPQNSEMTQWHKHETQHNPQPNTTYESTAGSGDQTNSQNLQLISYSQVK